MSEAVSIPPQFQAGGFRFVKLGQSGEALKRPIEPGWQTAANYGYDDPAILQHLGKGRNYGILNGSGPDGAGLTTLDADNLPRLAELVDFSKLPLTLEAGRRGEDGEPIPERRHFHYLSDLEGKHLLKDPETGEDLGDIRSTGGFQVVGPGSLHPSGAHVEVLADRPIAKIPGAELLDILKPVVEPSKLETNRSRLEALKPKRRPPTATDDPFVGVSILDVIDTSGFKESGGQLFGRHPVHGSDTDHNLVVNPAKNSWWCGRHQTGGGPALWLAVEAGVIACSEARPGALTGRRFIDTLEYARKRGIIPGNVPGETEGETRARISSDEDGGGMRVEILDALREDPTKIEDTDVKRALLYLRDNDRIKYALLVKDLPVGRRDLDKALDQLATRLDAEKTAEVGKSDRSEVPDEIKKAAREILEKGDPIKARCDYVTRRVEGNLGVAKAFIYSCASAFMATEDKLHTDAVGASQGGKSATSGAVHETYPPENVEILTEASPKSIYYFAQRCEAEGRSLDDTIIYINDAREEHIPVLKVFRDDGPGTPRNLTVVDGECVDLKVPGRPVVQSSSVLPLRDLEQQAVSRSFLSTITDTDEDGERMVRKKIRTGLEYGSLLQAEDDDEKITLQEMGRILRDEGVRNIVVPFDPTEPKGADRRGTGQFIRLIKISAHENQFQRPVLKMKDGSRYVLATYDDLRNAADLWFEFEEAQAFKINHKVLKVFKSLPTTEPDHYGFSSSSPTKNRIAKDTGIGPKSVGRYLDDLYGAGLIFRKKAGAPGNPHVFWTTDELRQKVVSEISASEDTQTELGQIRTKNGCLKYLGENCPDRLKSSLSSFFTNQDIISTENVKGILFRRGGKGGELFIPGEKIISSIAFLQNRVLNTPIEPPDADSLGHSSLSEIPDEKKIELEDSDSLGQGDSVRKAGDCVQGPENVGGEDYQTIAQNLAEADRRQAEHLEHFRTPELKQKGEERLFEKSIAYWRDLARQHDGLNVRVLMDELGYDDLKAGIALHNLKSRGWAADVEERLHPAVA